MTTPEELYGAPYIDQVHENGFAYFPGALENSPHFAGAVRFAHMQLNTGELDRVDELATRHKPISVHNYNKNLTDFLIRDYVEVTDPDRMDAICLARQALAFIGIRDNTQLAMVMFQQSYGHEDGIGKHEDSSELFKVDGAIITLTKGRTTTFLRHKSKEVIDIVAGPGDILASPQDQTVLESGLPIIEHSVRSTAQQDEPIAHTLIVSRNNSEGIPEQQIESIQQKLKKQREASQAARS